MGKKAADEPQADKRKGKGIAASAAMNALAFCIDKLKLSDVLPHISEDWLNGYARHKEAFGPVFRAREELKGYSEENARELWAQIKDCFNKWKTDCGTPPQLPRWLRSRPEAVDPSKIEPWFCAGPWVSDPADLLEHLDRMKYQPLFDMTSRVPIGKLLAVTILHEVSTGDDESDSLAFAIDPLSGHSANCHIIAAMKAEKQMTIKTTDGLLKIVDSWMPHVNSAKAKKELLALGRRMGAQANKEKAAQRRQAIRQAAIHFFVNSPHATVEDCAKWIKTNPQLRPSRSYGNGKELSADRIEKTIAGTKDEALAFLAERRSAQTSPHKV
ncbi:MAG: hypothetical protein ACREX4_07155 [Gammaproteobacteria bacterium]